MALPLPPPEVHTNPDLVNESITGLRTWLWVTGVQPVTVTGLAGPIGVSVTAHPTTTRWDLTEGSVDCAGLGRPYLYGQMESDAQTDCSFTFTEVSRDHPGGTFPAMVTVVWEVTWTAANGDGGSFGQGTTATPFRIAVDQRQSTTD